MDYLTKIKGAKTRHEAADLILANAAYNAAHLTCYRADQRVSIVEQAAQQADSLTRDYTIDGDLTVSECDHPWRRWLVEWGF